MLSGLRQGRGSNVCRLRPKVYPLVCQLGYGKRGKLAYEAADKITACKIPACPL